MRACPGIVLIISAVLVLAECVVSIAVVGAFVAIITPSALEDPQHVPVVAMLFAAMGVAAFAGVMQYGALVRRSHWAARAVVAVLVPAAIASWLLFVLSLEPRILRDSEFSRFGLFTFRTVLFLHAIQLGLALKENSDWSRCLAGERRADLAAPPARVWRFTLAEMLLAMTAFAVGIAIFTAASAGMATISAKTC